MNVDYSYMKQQWVRDSTKDTLDLVVSVIQQANDNYFSIDDYDISMIEALSLRLRCAADVLDANIQATKKMWRCS